MHQAGSTAAAGKALQELLQRAGAAGAPVDSALGWAKALSKPERAGGARSAQTASVGREA